MAVLLPLFGPLFNFFGKTVLLTLLTLKALLLKVLLLLNVLLLLIVVTLPRKGTLLDLPKLEPPRLPPGPLASAVERPTRPATVRAAKEMRIKIMVSLPSRVENHWVSSGLTPRRHF